MNASKRPVHPYVGCPIEYGYTGVHKRLLLARRFVDWRGKDVLDVGCGTGAYTVEIAREAHTVCGLDLTHEFLSRFQDRARGHANLRILQGRGEAMPFGDAQFDLIVSIETLEHVGDERATLHEMHRTLRHDGTLLLTVPNKRWIFEAHGLRYLPYSQYYPFASWLPKRVHSRLACARIYTEADIARLLDRGKWQNVRFEWLLPPLDLLNLRWLQRHLRSAMQAVEGTPLRRFGVSLVVAADKV
jgi:ubiquinone/menaquinone biosynthesis C-methylase UbiE